MKATKFINKVLVLKDPSVSRLILLVQLHGTKYKFQPKNNRQCSSYPDSFWWSLAGKFWD